MCSQDIGKEENNDTWNGDIWLYLDKTDHPEIPRHSEPCFLAKEPALWCWRMTSLPDSKPQEKFTWGRCLERGCSFSSWPTTTTLCCLWACNYGPISACSRAGFGKLQSMGQICPTICFHTWLMNNFYIFKK